MGSVAAQSAFDLSSLSKSYGTTHALRPTDLTVRRGATTVLIGPSGCGKSTLLRLLVGLIQPDGGTVHFDGNLVDHKHIQSMRRRMGYVIQDGGLFPHMTARDNVTIMAPYMGWSCEKTDNRLQELATLTHFPVDGLDRYPAQLSGGQRQRACLMRALMLDPEVLLLDEPLGALDPMIRSELQEDLRHIFRSLGKTVVMVTHDLAEAGFFADVVVLMRDGRILQAGSLADLIGAPADPFVTKFVHAQRPAFEIPKGEHS